MSNQPKPTGEWSYNYEAGYWAVTNGIETINGKTFGGPLIGIAMTEKSAKNLCDAHNAELAAEERRANDSIEKVQPLVDALIKIANDPYCDRCQVAVDALAKVKWREDDFGRAMR